MLRTGELLWLLCLRQLRDFELHAMQQLSSGIGWVVPGPIDRRQNRLWTFTNGNSNWPGNLCG